MELLNLVDIFKSQKLYTVEEDIPKSFWQGALDENVEDIKSHLKITIAPKGYMRYELSLKLEATVRAFCSVCLKDFEFDISLDEVFELLDKSLETYSKSHMLKEEEFYTYYINQEEFDPSEIVLDALVGAMPIKLLCEESCSLPSKVEQGNKSFAILKELLIKEEKNGGTKT
ncbi:MAG: YceD family protein [Hydrogenobaculum sp.]